MDTGDMEKLWVLFGTVWSHAPQIRDERLRLAWSLALEPYAYAEVRAAAAAYIRRNKYFPDICDITGGLAAVETGSAPLPAAPVAGDIRRMRALLAKIRSE